MGNAILRRVERLAELWAAFAADPGLRLLRWRADADELRMIHLFLDLQSEDWGTIPDVFVRLAPAFDDPERYAGELVAALLAQYDAARADLEARDVPADWQAPARARDEPEDAFLLRVAASLRDYHADRMRHLVLVLVPGAVADDRAFAAWLARLLESGVAPVLRLMVPDPAQAPRLDGLDELAPGLVATVDPALDMPGALEELARSEGVEGPARRFRIQLVNIGNAAGKNNLAAAERAARGALDLARKEGWADQAVVVHMALAAVYLGAGRPEDAIGCYRKAAAAAARAEAHPAAPRLRVTAAFGEGAALVAAARWAEAAIVYERAAPLAEAAGDPIMLLEGWRMAGWTHEQAGADRDAWRCGQQALTAGARLPAERRQESTLPWVGQMLLRLLDRHYRDDAHQAEALGQRLEATIGSGWQRALEPVGATP
jgi:tetratricopeptide (TPR) repeat protein